ncbi:YktB family protein [Neobacillus sp. NPDC093182]|uniref:YktB family protein n=1 Tax=Neobacillus sp. NPDC093182 TaxID=3364297 RepID=UPI00381AD6D5
MDFKGFNNEDFDVFQIDGLEARMEALKERIRPKLEYLGHYFEPALTSLTGDEMYVHVAKHARRTINPPKDTWVAFADNPRGYKMLPHFQIGLWNTHLFIWFAVIYEAPHKQEFAARFTKKINKIYKEIPKDFVWSLDHMKPESIQHGDLSKDDLLGMFERLENVKKAEILCGYEIKREDVIKFSTEEFLKHVEYVFNKVAPLYKIALNIK